MFRLGRWFRRVLLPSKLAGGFPPPGELSPVLEDCKHEGLLLAPLLSGWFIYEPGQRDTDVKAPNYTCSDIRWFVGNLVRLPGEEERRVSVRRDLYVCWSNRLELAGEYPCPCSEDPAQEWIVYTSWVQFVLGRGPTDQKSGRIRQGYPAWFRRNFGELLDPIGVVRR